MMKKMPRLHVVAALALAVTIPVLADGPKDNSAENVRPVPPPGVAIPEPDRAALTKGVAELKQLADDAQKAQAKNPAMLALLPDVLIYHKAVDWALRFNQFNNVKEVKTAYDQLAEGKKRAEALKNGTAYWLKQKGLVVRAYRSKIDGSIQPYGLFIPDSYSVDGAAPHRLDFWIHGRGETLSELSFVDQRTHQVGQIQPKDSIVLHLYGRYCCANKMAGEVDLFEALDHAKKYYQIDDNRIVVRGFSMGGASAWQFGTHYAGLWSAVNPGAGFAETPEFLNVFQSEDVSKIPDYQKKLWHLYNSSEYALNLANCPTIAYSGEIDKQKQAADVMERELKKEGLDMLHIIGPQTAHKIHPDSLVEIERRLADITAVGRDKTPKDVHFTTWTLRYNQMNWVTIDGISEHWERARVDASVLGDSSMEVKTSNVTALTLDFPAGHCPFDVLKKPRVVVDGKLVSAPQPKLDRSWRLSLVKSAGKWTTPGEPAKDAVLAKTHGLQGPIDDAFWDAFVFVTPTSTALNPNVDKWVKSEFEHATREWQKQFRGEAPQKKDTELKDEDIASNNIVLWGDPSSNAVLKKIADKLPIKWTAEGVEVGGKKYDANGNVPVLIYPNPLNPKRYVVINSSFTYREYDYLNNARQVPKLPDWAVVDLSEAPNAIAPGKIAAAGFFDESWKLKAAKKEDAPALNGSHFCKYSQKSVEILKNPLHSRKPCVILLSQTEKLSQSGETQVELKRSERRATAETPV